MNEKYAILTPFDVTQKMLGPYLFSNTARETLGDKMELYFHDHSFTPLFIQVGADYISSSRRLLIPAVSAGKLPQDTASESPESSRP